MSKIQELIKEKCPNGVQYKKLKDICKMETGKLNANAAVEDGEYNFYTTSKKISKIDTYRWDTEALLIAGNANVGDVKYYKGKFEAYQRTYVLTEFDDYIVVKYLYHILSNNLKKYLDTNKNEAAMTYIVLKTLENFKIPIPPIEVQEEIVRILDKFGELEIELESELEMELEARKSQYEFWCGKLLFNPKYPIVKMEDICVINQGLQIPINQRKTEPGDNRYFYITVQFLKNEGDNYYIENPSENVICKKDDILVTRTGSTGKIIYGVEGCFHNNFFKVTPTIDLNKKYLYYVLNSTQMFNEILRVSSGGTVPDLPHKKFYKLEISLPSIEEQKKIVDFLDKFEILINDILEGLTAEIEVRRKQYEYYRNKLLSFEEVSCE